MRGHHNQNQGEERSPDRSRNSYLEHSQEPYVEHLEERYVERSQERSLESYLAVDARYGRGENR